MNYPSTQIDCQADFLGGLEKGFECVVSEVANIDCEKMEKEYENIASYVIDILKM